MAQLVVAAAGAALGAAIPGVGAAIGWSIGSIVGSAFGPKQESFGPRLNDLAVSGTEYGQPIPWVAGSPRTGGQIIWASKRRETASTESQGKGGGPKYTSYTYDVDLMYLLTENEIDGVGRVWINGELVYDGAVTKEGVWSDMIVYTGAEDQLPDPTYEADVGAGKAPAYRSRGTVVIKGLQLGNSGAIPNITFEVGVGLASEKLAPQNIYPWGFTRQFIEDGVPVCTKVEAPLHGECLPEPHTEYEVIFPGPAPGQTFPKFYTIEDALAQAVARAAEPGSLGPYGGEYNAGTHYLGYLAGNGWPSFFPSSDSPQRLEDGPEYITLLFGIAPLSDIKIDDTSVDPSENGSYCALVPVMTGPEISRAGDAGNGSSSWNTILKAGNYGFEDNPPNSDYPYAVNNCRDVGLGFYRIQGAPLTKIRARRIPQCAPKCEPITYPDAEPARQLTLVEWTEDRYLQRQALGPVVLFGDERYDDEAWWRSQAQGAGIDVDGLEFGVHFGVQVNKACLCGGVGSGKDVSRPIEDVVSDLMIRAGYESADFDVSGLEGNAKGVRALAISQISSTRSVLEILASAYYFTASKAEQIVFRNRSALPVATVPYRDLAASPDIDPQADPLALTVANDLEMPAQIAVTYSNVDADYQTGTEMSDRLLSGQESNSQVQLPLGFKPAEAKGIADAMLLDQVAGMTSTKVSIPLEYAALEAGDVVLVQTQRGDLLRMRLVNRQDDGLTIGCGAVLDDPRALPAVGITDDTPNNAPPVQQLAGTDWNPLDIPILRDADNSPGYYVALAKRGEGQWGGAGWYEAKGSSDFEQRFVTGTQAVMGSTETVLGGMPFVRGFDESNTLVVDVRKGQLFSSTRQAMLADEAVNAMLVGDEVLRFREAELLGAGRYRISGLVRGLRGTEWATGIHIVGERCVLLNAATINRVTTNISDIGAQKLVKAVTVNRALSTETAMPFTDTGVAMKPFSPVDLRSQPTADGLLITWVRRTRLQVRYAGPAGIAVPLGESSERYSVMVYKDNALIRTAEVNFPAWQYTDAQRLGDGVSAGDELEVRVAQISEYVGEGYTLSSTIEIQ